MDGLEDIEGDLVDGGHVGVSVPGSGSGLVLSEDDVEHPVGAFVDGPVVSDGLGEGVGRPGAGRHIVMSSAGSVIFLSRSAFDLGDPGARMDGCAYPT